MTWSAESLWAELQDLPLLSDVWSLDSTLAAALSVRKAADRSREPLAAYLQPPKAQSIYRANLLEDLPPVGELSAEEVKQVRTAIGRIVEAVPGWKRAFAIPVEFSKIDGCASMTNRWVPQRIYLGQVLFEQPQALSEYLVHEFAHVWCAFVMEAFEFQSQGAAADLTLPSGTKNKSPSGVVLAAHFAACLLRYLGAVRHTNADSEISERIQKFEGYLRGCQEALRSSTSLTEMGAIARKRLNRYLEASEWNR